MICSINSNCGNSHLQTVDNQVFCFNCYGLYEKNIKKPIFEKYKCCDNLNIIKTPIQDICNNCGNIEMIFSNQPSFLENDEYQTNILYKSKKVHVPYKYPKIKYEKIYNFILESIQYIHDVYKLKRKSYSKYVPYLCNFYQEQDQNVPIIQHFNEDKELILDLKFIGKLNDLYIKYSDRKKIINKSKNIKSDNIDIKPVDDEQILNKYYYFNKSQNQYFKKLRYCQFDNCHKIGNFKDTNNKNYCKPHSNNNVVNINNKSKVIKCNYNNCKKNIKYINQIINTVKTINLNAVIMNVMSE